MATQTEMKEFLTQKVEPDLLFAWSSNDVEVEVQYSLAQVKITSLGRFASIEDDKDAFNKLMVETRSIEEDTIGGKVALADLITAWSTAKSMSKAEIEKKGDVVRGDRHQGAARPQGNLRSHCFGLQG